MRHGISLIEIVIVVGFIAVLGVIVLVNVTGKASRSELDQTTTRMVALLREAQSRAISQEFSATWGVHFENSTTTRPFFELFYGTYGTSTVVGHHPLLPRVRYNSASIPVGASTEVTFSEIAGRPAASTSITIELTADPSQTSTVTVGVTGVINYE